MKSVYGFIGANEVTGYNTAGTPIKATAEQAQAHNRELVQVLNECNEKNEGNSFVYLVSSDFVMPESDVC